MISPMRVLSGSSGVLAADYPFLDVVWTTVVLVALVLFLWLVVAVLTDAFRRHDAGAGKKVAWTVFVIIVPVVGVFAYLIANGDGMASRGVEHSGTATAEIERAKRLLDDGAITAAEFEAIKTKTRA